MTSVASRPAIISEPIEQTIRRLERFVARMERRYECPSDFAVQAVACGHMKETAEVCRWLISYRTAQRLKERVGREPGKSTTSTR